MSRLAELLRQAAGDALAAGGGDAGADHGEAGPGHQPRVAQRPQQRRRRIDRGQHLRVAGVAEDQQPRSQPVAFRHLRLHLGRRGQGETAIAAPADHIGEGLQGAGGAAEALEKLAEGDGADAVRAGQPQPGEPLGRVEGHVFFAPIRGSAPFIRRPMFSLWRIQISTAVKAARARIGAGAGRPRAASGSRA